MPNPYDKWLDDMLGPMEPAPEVQPWQPPAPPVRKPRRPKPAAPPPQEDQMSDLQRYGAMGVRGVAGLFGVTPVSGAIAGGLGEVLAQGIEEGGIPELSKENLAHVGGEAAAGAVGGGFAKLLMKLGGAPLKAAVAGGLMGGAAPILRHGISEGEWDPRKYAGEVALAGGLSAATGGIVSKLSGYPKVPSEAPKEVYHVETTAVPGGRGYQGGHIRTSSRGGTTLEGATTGVNQPINPIIGSGEVVTVKPPQPTDPAVVPHVPYVGMPSVTQKQQRMIEAEQKAAQKAEDEAARLQQIQDEMDAAGLTEADRQVNFSRTTNATDPDGRKTRMVERFAKETDEGDDVATQLAENHPYYVDKRAQGTGPDLSPEQEVEQIKAQMAELQAQMAPPAVPNRRGSFMDMFRQNPPARSQAVGVGNPPEAPLPPLATPELPPSAPVQAPEAPSGLAGLLTPKKGGKRAPRTPKSKVQKFDEGIDAILRGVDEGVPPVEPPTPLSFEAGANKRTNDQLTKSMASLTPEDITKLDELAAPSRGFEPMENRLGELPSPNGLSAGPRPVLPESPISQAEQDIILEQLSQTPEAWAAQDQLTKQLSNLRPAQEGLDLLGKSGRYGRLQSLFKAGAGSKDEAREAGKLLRYAAGQVDAPIGKAAQPAQTLGDQLQASVAASGAGNWVDEENALIQRLSQLPPEQRLAAFLEEGVPSAPASLAAESSAPTDWVQQATSEVDDLLTKRAANRRNPDPVEPVIQKTGKLPKRMQTPENPEVQQVSELAKLLKASGAIKGPEELGDWMARFQRGEAVMPEGPPALAPEAPTPTVPTMGGGRQHVSQERVGTEAPLPQDYSPTPSGKAPRASKKAPVGAQSTVGEGPSVEKPYAVVVTAGKTIGSQSFGTIEEAQAFQKAALETGKFTNVKIQSLADTKTTNLQPRLNKGKKGEAGFASPELLARLGLAGAGAAAGAAYDDEDPVRGALIGGAAGAALPSVAKGLTELGANPPSVGKAIERLQHDGDTYKAAETIAKTLPQYVRFNYLADLIGIPANAGFGPWGSGMFGTLERSLAGDPRAWEAFKEISNPINFLKELPSSFKEAQSLVGRAEGFALSEASTGVEKSLAVPGTFLTAGDVAIRRILQRHGFSDDEARIMTMTSEPFTKTGESGAHLRGLGWDLAFPFKRTPINIVEQGFLRTPGLGFYMQGIGAKRGTRAADPFAQQLFQQAMGAGVGLGANQLGQELDPESAKALRRYITNTAGPYGLLAGLGLATGQAQRRGKEGRQLVNEMARTLPYHLPMPSLEPAQDALRYAADPENLEKLPRGTYPAALFEQLKTLLSTPEEDPFESLARRRR